MSNSSQDSGTPTPSRKARSQGPWFPFAILFGLVLCFTAPLLSLLSIRWIAPDLLPLYLTHNMMEKGFYQFVLGALTFLIAVGGFLTYRSRQDLIKEMREEADARLKEEKAQWEKQKREFETWANEMKMVVEAEIGSFRSKVGEATESLSKEAEATRAKISSFAMPTLGESDSERDARLSFNRGVELYKKGDRYAAIAKWREARQLGLEVPEIHNNIGIALAETGDLEGAVIEYKEALRLKPDNPKANYNLACVHALLGKPELAAPSLRTAIGLDAKYRDMAIKDNDFESVRKAPEIVALLGEPETK